MAALPIVAYSFDEASGEVIDHSGGGRSFSLTGNTVRTLDTEGHTGRALTQIAGDVQPIPSLVSLQTPQRTWMAWIRATASFTGWFMEFHRSAEDTGVWGLLYLSGSLNWRCKNSSNTVFQSTGIPPDFGNWHHIAATHDGANLRTYRDGVLISTTAVPHAIWTADGFRMLDQVGSAARMDDVRGFDVALTAEEIQAWMALPADQMPAQGGRLKYESAPGIWTPVPLKLATGEPLIVKSETSPGTWEALP
jgi:hypothetical protein